MSTFFRFYKPVYNPTGMSGMVGGAISTTELLPRLDYLFAPRECSDSIDVVQYRKLWIKQVYDATMTGLTIQLVNLDYPEQIYFNTTTGTNDTTASPGTAPDGVSFTGSYLVDIALTGTTVSGSTIPIWIQQTISADSGDDDFVAFQIRILGTIV